MNHLEHCARENRSKGGRLENPSPGPAARLTINEDLELVPKPKVEPLELTEHAGCPVWEGEKWITTARVREGTYEWTEETWGEAEDYYVAPFDPLGPVRNMQRRAANRAAKSRGLPLPHPDEL